MTLQKYLSINDVSLNRNKKDLTNDLPSLNFETALSKEELSYLSLRARHHCFTVATCAYAVYLVSTFNELRLEVLIFSYENTKSEEGFFYYNFYCLLIRFLVLFTK